MKICSIHIKGYQQFKDLYLDFTNPETGEPVDKICFIGKNGTGKSTILKIIKNIINNPLNFAVDQIDYSVEIPFVYVKIKLKYEEIYLFYSRNVNQHLILDSKIESVESWFEKLSLIKNPLELIYSQYIIKGERSKRIQQELLFINSANDLLIFSPAESQQNNYLQINDVPTTTLNNALKLFKNFPCYHEVSDQNAQQFWKILIYLVKKRDTQREIFENKDENLNKTKKELIEEFEKKNPKILNKIGELWNKILDPAGLIFDVENASNPIQLNDNLKAYIKLKSTGEKIAYNQLSTGIRNFIFRVGHIYSLYFNREIKRGILLLDEPSNGLFPDFLFELVETYQELLKDKNGENNTQFFVATHNPIIAAQFEPYERIILEWDENAYVNAYKGIAPIGDDPNDLLSQDFKLTHLMGKKGQEMWEHYLELRKKLRKSKDGTEKKELVSKINKIGSDYNFED